VAAAIASLHEQRLDLDIALLGDFSVVAFVGVGFDALAKTVIWLRQRDAHGVQFVDQVGRHPVPIL